MNKDLTFALVQIQKPKKWKELQSVTFLSSVCCPFCHFPVLARHVKSTLGPSLAVCELRVYIRLAALCCVSNSQSSWQHLSRPSNHHAALWLRTAPFLCVTLCQGVCFWICAALCSHFGLSLHVCKTKKKMDGVCLCVCVRESVCDGCLLACLAARWDGSAFTNLDRGEWAGKQKVIYPNLGLSRKNEAIGEWVTLFTTK